MASSPESAVESILAQAADLVALEQIARLNTCHLSDPVLPSDVESRFRKLASFPTPSNPLPSLRRLRTDTDIPTIPDRSETEPPPPATKPQDQQVPLNNPKDSEPELSSPDVESPPPPKSFGCFGCYLTRKRGTKNDEILSDLKSQERKLKKMLREQEEVNREAEKVLGLVKQASARLVVDHELPSEDDDEF